MRNNTPQQLHGSSEEKSEGTRLHTPVLLEKVVSLLSPEMGESYLDLTAGYGGHASEILKATGAANKATLVDRDPNAIRELERFKQSGAQILHDDFASTAEQLVQEGKHYDMVLLDLGVSSPQLDRAERGFSFTYDGPLDMRMDTSSERTAADIVNRTPERELTDIIHRYGEEYPALARRIAHQIVLARPLRTTHELATAVKKAYGPGYRKTHPATRTFQAIRIALNDELGQLERTLPLLPQLLEAGGRVAVISFHSLEDRLVKRYFAEQAHAGYEAELTLLTKKPILGALEDVHNPRSRSAILRAAVKK